MRRLLLLALLSSPAGCAPASDSSPDFNRAASFRAIATQIQLSANARYRFAVDAMTEATCAAVHRGYQTDVRADLVNLRLLAPDIDALIAAHDDGTHVDAGCTTAAIATELDAHAMVACLAATIEENRAEGVRHIDAVVALTMHATGRMDEVIDGVESEATGAWTWTLPSRCP